MGPDLAEKLLQYIQENESIDTYKLAEIWNVDHQKIVGAVKSIQARGELLNAEPCTHTTWCLTEEGKYVLENGSHEAVVFNLVPEKGIPLDELKGSLKNKTTASVGFSKAMALGWITLDKSSGPKPIVNRKVASIADMVREHINLISTGSDNGTVDDKLKQDYKKRKLIQEGIINSYILSKGSEFSLTLEKPETDLTCDMIADGSWKQKTFKPYNFNALGAPITSGHLHPLQKIKAEVGQIFLELGFQEMPTNIFIESSFWNFDALYVPQQHPARDAHDTFYMNDPKSSKTFPREFLEAVKTVHSVGGFGSQGYQYDWKLEEAEKNVLRTHTTAVSARMLYKLAKEGFKPVKYFSIDKVFRNETLDATHLAEFHQVEGVLADYNIHLGHLIGILHQFFKKLGMEKLAFKPAYNPYTEPSMEIFSFHSGLNKWIEVGNSGMFRPELLRPMGIPPNVNVFGWGLSLERPTMIKYKINNIRDLIGPRVNLKMVEESGLCRLDKHSLGPKNSLLRAEQLEAKLDAIISDLYTLTKEVASINKCLSPNDELTEDIVLFSNPEHVPWGIVDMLQILSKKCNLSVTCYRHSSLPNIDITNNLPKLFETNNVKNCQTNPTLKVAWIWKNMTCSSVMSLSPVKNVTVNGEPNILRFLNRLLEKYTQDMFVYELGGDIYSSVIDMWLDRIYDNKDNLNKFLNIANNQLKVSNFIAGDSYSVADIYLWSLLRTSNTNTSKVPIKIQQWISRIRVICSS